MLNQPLEGLIERVAGAAGPDRFLDAHIRVALEPPADDDSVTDCPFYTSSIDAALGLVERLLPDCAVDLTMYTKGRGACVIWKTATGARAKPVRITIGDSDEQNATLPLAIILALLKALRAIQSTKTGNAA